MSPHLASQQDKVVIYECSHCYDPSNIEEALADLFVHLHRIVCPSSLGFPVTRKRVYGVLISRKHIYEFYHREVPKSYGVPAELPDTIPYGKMKMLFEKVMCLFQRKCLITFHSLLVATEDEIDKECEWMAGRPKALTHWTPVDASATIRELRTTNHGCYQFLTNVEQQNFKEYLAILSKKMPDAVLRDVAVQLNQTARVHAMYSKNGVHHTLIKNIGIIFCQDRSITVEELALTLIIT